MTRNVQNKPKRCFEVAKIFRRSVYRYDYTVPRCYFGLEKKDTFHGI